MVAVNQTGVWLGMRTALPELKKSGNAAIVNISSLYGLVGSPSNIAYGSLYLCSDEAVYVTGIELPIDAGWSAA